MQTQIQRYGHSMTGGWFLLGASPRTWAVIDPPIPPKIPQYACEVYGLFYYIATANNDIVAHLN